MNADVRLLLSILLMPAICAAAPAQRCERIPVQYSRLDWVAQEVTVRGVPTWIAQLQTKETTKEVVRQAREYWRSNNIPAHGDILNGSITVQALDGNCLYLLLVPDGFASSHVTANYTAMSLKAAPEKAKYFADVPMPGPVDLLDMESRDGDLIAKTGQYDLLGTPLAEGHAYQDILKANGWEVQTSVPVSAINDARSYVLAARKGPVTLDAAFVSTNGRTQAVVNVSRPR